MFYFYCIYFLKPGKVKVGDDKYRNQCKKITIQSIEINSADDESLTLMSDQTIPADMQDSGKLKIVFSQLPNIHGSGDHTAHGPITTSRSDLFNHSGPCLLRSNSLDP